MLLSVDELVAVSRLGLVDGCEQFLGHVLRPDSDQQTDWTSRVRLERIDRRIGNTHQRYVSSTLKTDRRLGNEQDIQQNVA